MQTLTDYFFYQTNFFISAEADRLRITNSLGHQLFLPINEISFNSIKSYSRGNNAALNTLENDYTITIKLKGHSGRVKTINRIQVFFHRNSQLREFVEEIEELNIKPKLFTTEQVQIIDRLLPAFCPNDLDTLITDCLSVVRPDILRYVQLNTSKLRKKIDIITSLMKPQDLENSSNIKKEFLL